LDARSILSFGIFSARAAIIAARSRDSSPDRARELGGTVIFAASLPKQLDFAASCPPLACMMFLNCDVRP